MRRLSALALGSLLVTGCSSQPASNPTGPGNSGTSSASRTASSSGSTTPGSSGSSGGASSSTTGSGGGTSTSTSRSSGTSTSESGGGADAGGGDATVGGDGGGGSADGGVTDSGVVSAQSIVCNSVLGIDSTSEWFTGGFENEVPNAKWQIIYFHPGYVEDWADASDPVWTTSITSACTTNSTNPDRVIFNAFSDPSDSTYGNATTYAAGLTAVVGNIKKKYPGVKRVDLLAMTRAPNNMPCDPSNRESIVETWVDSAMAMVAANYPGFVTVSPKFYAPSCDDFASGGPHFSDAGKPIIAKLYGDYYSTEP
jgi:hypothetical protein